jgi:hypothetical protein
VKPEAKKLYGGKSGGQEVEYLLGSFSFVCLLLRELNLRLELAQDQLNKPQVGQEASEVKL